MSVGTPPPPPPPPQPPPRSNSALIVTVVVVIVVVAGGFFLFVTIQLQKDADCCSTPIASVFALGNATSDTLTAGGSAKAGCSVPTAGTEYCDIIPIAITRAGVATNSISLQMTTPNGTILPHISVTLLDGAGNGIALIVPGGSWVSCTPSSCGVPTSSMTLPATLTAEMKFVLNAGPSSSFPSGLAKYGLNAIGVGHFNGATLPITLA